MKDLKRYDISECKGCCEDKDGIWCLADDVDALEKARKINIQQLQDQFEEELSSNENIKFDKMNNGAYYSNYTQIAWHSYFACAAKNNLLKEGEV